MNEEHKRWKEVMALAEKYQFIVQAYGGMATLATHEEQKKAGVFERTQRMYKAPLGTENKNPFQREKKN